MTLDFVCDCSIHVDHIWNLDECLHPPRTHLRREGTADRHIIAAHNCLHHVTFLKRRYFWIVFHEFSFICIVSVTYFVSYYFFLSHAKFCIEKRSICVFFSQQIYKWLSALRPPYHWRGEPTQIQAPLPS